MHLVGQVDGHAGVFLWLLSHVFFYDFIIILELHNLFPCNKKLKHI